MDKSDWMKGIFFSVLASVVGAGSKLAIRKGWLMDEVREAAAEEAFMAEAAVSDEEEAGSTTAAAASIPPGSDGGPPISHVAEPCETPPDDEPMPSTGDGVQQEPSRKRGKSIYTAVQPSQALSPIAGTASSPCPSVASTLEHPVIESTAIAARRICCSMPQFLRLCGMFGMTFVNPTLCVLAMNYASPSILAPFSGLTLVWVIVLSHPLIGESPTMSQKVASSLIVLGEVMVATFGDHTNDQHTTIANVEASYRELPFVLYFVFLLLWMLLMWLWIASSHTSPTLQRFAWGASGGSTTGVAQCFIKDALVVLKASKGIFRGPWYLPLFIFLGMALSFAGLLFLTATMKRYDATYSAAMFVGSFVVSASIMSAAHYHTFENLAGVTDYIMYPLGLVTLMVGVHILVQRGTQAPLTDRNRSEEIDMSDDAVQILYAAGDRRYEPPASHLEGNNGERGDKSSKVPKNISGTDLTTDTQRTASTTESDGELVC